MDLGIFGDAATDKERLQAEARKVSEDLNEASRDLPAAEKQVERKNDDNQRAERKRSDAERGYKMGTRQLDDWLRNKRIDQGQRTKMGQELYDKKMAPAQAAVDAARKALNAAEKTRNQLKESIESLRKQYNDLQRKISQMAGAGWPAGRTFTYAGRRYPVTVSFARPGYGMTRLSGDNGMDGYFLKARYSPEVVSFMGGLGDETPEWYARVNRAQNSLAALNAAINAIGETAWGAVAGGLQQKKEEGGTVPYFLDFGSVNEMTGLFLAESYPDNILVTKYHVPSEATLQRAESKAVEISQMIETVKQLLPETRAAAEAEYEKAQRALANSELKSPVVEGEKAFVDNLEKRLAAIGNIVGGVGLGLGTIALVGLGVIAFMALAPMLRGKS